MGKLVLGPQEINKNKRKKWHFNFHSKQNTKDFKVFFKMFKAIFEKEKKNKFREIVK